MNIKPIKASEFKKYRLLDGQRKARRLEWLIHTGYATEIINNGQKSYKFLVTVGRNINEIVIEEA